MTQTLELLRDPDSGKIILSGYTGSRRPQLIIRERQGGRSLSKDGWQLSPTYVPLRAVPKDRHRFVLDVDPDAASPGSGMQLEIPSDSFSQEALWPSATEAPPPRAASQPPSPPERVVPAGIRPGRTADPGRSALPPTKRQDKRRSRLAWAAILLFCTASGAAAGWLWALQGRMQSEAVIASLQAQLLTAKEQNKDDTAALAEQRFGLDAALRQLAADRSSLQNQQLLLEQQKAQLASERSLFEQQRSQTPSAGPSASASALPPPIGGLAAPGDASPDVFTAQQAAGECDMLAANPMDRSRTPGVPGAPIVQLRINSAPAIAACRLAMEAQPGQLRYAYQLARALQYTTPQQAAPILLRLTEAGYAAAYDNMAWIIIARDQDFRAAEVYLRRGVELSDADAMVSLARLLSEQRIPLRPGDDVRLLYRRAKALGHEGASLALADTGSPAFAPPGAYPPGRMQQPFPLDLGRIFRRN